MNVPEGTPVERRDAASRPSLCATNDDSAAGLIGRLARVGVSTQAPFEVIGIVGDDRHAGVDADPTPTFFVPYRQLGAMREIAILARGDADAAAIVGGLRAAIRSLDAEMPFYQVQTLEQVVNASMATPRSLAWLLSGFALSGLLLAAIGVFGVLSHAVTQRTQEIGVRIAVGASPGQVLGMVLREGLLQVGLGIVAGIAIALRTSRLLAGLLFGVTTASVTPYVTVSLLLTAVTLAACAVPARRAMKVDPVAALRAD